MFQIFFSFLLLIGFNSFTFSTDEISLVQFSHSGKLLGGEERRGEERRGEERRGEERRGELNLADFSDLTERLLVHHPSDGSPVNQWLEECVLQEADAFKKCTKNSIFAFEVVSGLARGAVYFSLGYDLAKRLGDSTGIDVLATFYALGVALPMVILGGEKSGSVIKALISKKAQAEKDIEKDFSKWTKASVILKNISIACGGMLSASTMTYMTYDQFNHLIGYGWLAPGIPTFYVRTLLDYYATPEAARMLYRSFKDRFDRKYAPIGERRLLIKSKDRLTRSIRFFSSLTNSQAKRILKYYDENIDDPLAQQSILFHPNGWLHLREPEEDSVKKKICGLLGAAVGVYGIWVYLTPTEDAFRFTKQFNLSEHAESQLKTALAYIALTAASAITGISSRSSAMKFYSATSGLCSSIFSKIKGVSSPDTRVVEREDKLFKLKRLGGGFLAVLLACCNAGMQSEVALEFLDIRKPSAVVDLIACMVSQFSISFWAVDEALLKYLEGGDPKTLFIKKLQLIIDKLPDMSHESLENLRDLYKKTKQKTLLFNQLSEDGALQ